jgi:hypothetical protein
MKLSARRNLAAWLTLVGVGALLAAYYVSGFFESWWVFGVLFGLAVLLLLLAFFAEPPFWWGRHSFTTPLEDPSHEAKQRNET